MSDETQVTPEASQDSFGTSDQGQSNQSVDVQSSNQANDSEMMRADYTRKTMELAEQRRQFEAERQAFEQARYQNQGYQQQSYPTQVQGQSDQAYQQQLVEQFGHEGAQAILADRAYTQQQLNQVRFESLKSQEEFKGRMKYGEAWDKFNYIDPRTGLTSNRVLDLRCSLNPITGQAITLEQAWNALNPVDPKTIEQEALKKAYAEIEAKSKARPNSQPGSAPKGGSNAKALTVAEAFRMAQNEMS